MTHRHLAFVAFSLLLACSDDGRRPARDTGTPPDTSGFDAGPVGCTAGQPACDGATHYVCGADGMTHTMEMRCEGACDPSAGCVTCTPGGRRCEGTVSMVCAPDASGFVTARDCAENGAECGANGFCQSACGSAEASRSNIGCEYWPVALTNGGNYTADRYDFRVVVANPDETREANVRVFRGATMATSVSVPAGGLREIALPWIEGQSNALDGTENAWTSVSMANGAYRLLSDRPVTVAQFNPFEYDNGRLVPNPSDPFGPDVPDLSYTNDASLLLPSHAFTGEYYVSAYSPLSIDAGSVFGPAYGKYPPYVAVVGVTPEPTTVSVRVTAAVAADGSGRFPATAAGGVVTFTIQRDEVVTLFGAPPPDCSSSRPGYITDEFQSYCNEAGFDLTGSRVIANHPVAVFGGHVCAYIPYNAQACDHVESQMPPAQTLGTEYVSAPMVDPSGGNTNIVRVLAALDGTDVTITPPQGGVGSVSLGAGEWREFAATSAFSVSATRGVLVTQYLVGQLASSADRGDPSMVVLPPVEQYRSDYTFVTPSSYSPGTGGQSYLLIVRPPGLAITLDGAAVGGSFQSVGGSEIGIVPLAGGTHQMAAPAQFGVIVFGMGRATSYAYPAGLNLEEILLI